MRQYSVYCISHCPRCGGEHEVPSTDPRCPKTGAEIVVDWSFEILRLGCNKRILELRENVSADPRYASTNAGPQGGASTPPSCLP